MRRIVVYHVKVPGSFKKQFRNKMNEKAAEAAVEFLALMALEGIKFIAKKMAGKSTTSEAEVASAAE
jgi:hypothetical protein